MTRLSAATQRLEQAIARLEAAAARPRTQAGPVPAAQRAQLAAELDQARQETVAIRDGARAVMADLDATIARVRSLLGR
ncbi:MAG: hypothetical protein FJX67_12530 [Alphaproteobacteria bacterium]|nr:hypothetical protein [Alphaproteobacteria bacterium]